MNDPIIFEPSPRMVRYGSTAYFSTLLGCVLAIFLLVLPRSSNPPPASEVCASRWEGEIVALRRDSAGKYYCDRVDYSIRQKRTWHDHFRRGT